MAHGKKRIETRSWKTAYTGPLAICAAAKGMPDKDLRAWLGNKVANKAMEGVQLYPGYIVGVCDLMACMPTVSILCQPGVFDDYPKLQNETELALGDYTQGRYAWVTENMFRLPRPIPYKGRQGLFAIEEKTQLEIREQLCKKWGREVYV
jgi:hypothetical protein